MAAGTSWGASCCPSESPPGLPCEATLPPGCQPLVTQQPPGRPRVLGSEAGSTGVRAQGRDASAWGARGCSTWKRSCVPSRARWARGGDRRFFTPVKWSASLRVSVPLECDSLLPASWRLLCALLFPLIPGPRGEVPGPYEDGEFARSQARQSRERSLVPEGTCRVWGAGHGADGSGRGQSGQMRGPCWRANSCTGASQSLACGRLRWNLSFCGKGRLVSPQHAESQLGGSAF